ncbi:MAG: hypothetical protein ACFFC7_31465 [Candidatus Hermodarchaeota archaeon]
MKKNTLLSLVVIAAIMTMSFVVASPGAAAVYIPSYYGETSYVHPNHSRVWGWGRARYAAPWAANGLPAKVNQIKMISRNVAYWCDRNWDLPWWLLQWKTDFYQLGWQASYGEVDRSCNNRAILLAAALRVLHNEGLIHANIVFAKGLGVKEDNPAQIQLAGEEPTPGSQDHYWIQVTIVTGSVNYYIWVDAWPYQTRYGPTGFQYQTTPFTLEEDVFHHPTGGDYKFIQILDTTKY